MRRLMAEEAAKAKAMGEDDGLEEEDDEDEEEDEVAEDAEAQKCHRLSNGAHLDEASAASSRASSRMMNESMAASM